MISETPERPGFVGSSRFLQRGTVVLPETRLAGIRVAINEYPERYPLEPNFPQPGRRGGSRAPARTGGAAAPGGAAPAGEGGAGGLVPFLPPSVFPRPREREGSELVVGGSLPAPGGEGATAIRTCAASGGIHLQRATEVGSTVTDAVVSNRIDRPFRVTYVGFFCNTAVTPHLVQARFVLSSNNDVSAGINSDGVSLDEGVVGTVDFAGAPVLTHSYPNKIWTAVPAYIKLLVFNGTAGTFFFQWVANLEWLD